jgi:large conductance mechanosensitive channel
MGFISEFRTFALKGNVVDLAIGVIIGAAFSKIVNSLIEDVITPLLLKPVLEAANLTELDKLTVFGTVKYGVFISACINFIIVALILFLIIRAINRMQTKTVPPPAALSSTDKLLIEIRDELRNTTRPL